MTDDWTVVADGPRFRVLAPGGGETRGRFHTQAQAAGWIWDQRVRRVLALVRSASGDPRARSRDIIRLIGADAHGANERAIPR